MNKNGENHKNKNVHGVQKAIIDEKYKIDGIYVTRSRDVARFMALF